MTFLPVILGRIRSIRAKSNWSFRPIRTTWLMLLLAGCMTTPPRPSTTSAWRMGDLDAPLGAQIDQPGTQNQQQANRPLTAPPAAKAPATKDSQDSMQSPQETVRHGSPGKRKAPDVPKADAADVGDAKGPRHAISPAPGARGPALNGRQDKQLPLAESAPQIVPSEVTVPPALEFTVSGPSRKQLGSSATFHLTLSNSGDGPLEKLAVRCAFDDALVFAGSDKREVRQRVDRLAVGESKDLALSLAATSAGSHCCWFTVTRGEGDAETELVSKQVCVEFVTRHVEIEIAGPTQRTEGSRAEFNVTLSNTSLKTIADARAVITFDKALIPKEASADAEQKAGSLAWRLGSLGPLERVQLQVEFECHSQAHRACVAVEVKGSNLPGAGDQDEACLEILPVPGTLDLQIGDRDDPLEVGQSGTFEVTVENIGLQPARRVVIETAASENLKVLSAKVLAGGRDMPLKYTLEGSRLVFDQVTQLEPAVRLVYVIEVEALKAGPAEMRASLSSSLSSTPVTTAEPMTIVEP